jgi:hypothetical protein
MTDWLALLVAGLALMFTLASFWWLNARLGKLESYEPHSFAAAVNLEAVVMLRFPLVLYNTGARPIVVQNLRLFFPEETAAIADMPWRITRTKLRPDPDDYKDLPAAFAVPGRTAQQVFIEFGGPFPGVVPRGRDYLVRIEAKLGHKAEWTPLLTFTLHAQHITSPTQYIAYSNSEIPLTSDEVAQANAATTALIQQLQGLCIAVEAEPEERDQDGQLAERRPPRDQRPPRASARPEELVTHVAQCRRTK